MINSEKERLFYDIWSQMSITTTKTTIPTHKTSRERTKGYFMSILAKKLMFVMSQRRREVVPSLGSPMAIAAGDTPGALDESLWQYDETTDTGYYGLVSSVEFIDGFDLASQLSFTSGNNLDGAAGWLKFYIGPEADCNENGIPKCIFVYKAHLRSGVTYNTLEASGIRDGSTKTNISGNVYKVRLLTGAFGFSGYTSIPGSNANDNSACEKDAGEGSEYNDLMYRVSSIIPMCPTTGTQYSGYHGGPQDSYNFADFDTSTLVIGTRLNRMEITSTTNSANTHYIWRGYHGIADFSGNSDKNRSMYWRPVLEYVP